MGTKSYGDVQANDHSKIHLGDINYYGNQERLKHIPDALFNAYGRNHHACHTATRRELLEEIKKWTEHPTGKSIFWLNGMAGTGKSTIAYTIAEWLSQQGPSARASLGASFFFQRGEGGRASTALFFPTIVHQLRRKITGLDLLVEQAIDNDPDICSKSIGEQFDKLLWKPLQALHTTYRRPTLVIVVDALDECNAEADIEILLRLWSTLSRSTNVRIQVPTLTMT
ncbi:hypothetical protein H2198_010140 [Neophaeococcomyces mojaviensis]|uniref:Uncharacterized protein n=1 Tax=Neophaeococcomyces mojaviensis TaxID=3383035 RepID=A0ACC2ZSK8_9EURO|nr:hypothetical protein H2198_010140 [Knufia sp. JES_112]